jgi:tetratricopeptide (TPR) repeat protein
MPASTNKKALELKDKGNKAFSAKNYHEAIRFYDQAIREDGTDETFHSNRSACYYSLGQYPQALEDAQACVRIAPQWVKGYYRCGLSHTALKNWVAAVASFKKALELEPSNADVAKLLREAEENAAKSPPTKDENGNPLSKAGGYRYLGNQFYKRGKIPEAIDMYTTALQYADDEEKDTIYSNRSLCHQQLYDYRSVVDDCTKSLDHNSNNVKALIRRGIALEALEKYKDALEDMRKALSIEPGATAASQAVTRLTRAINQLA